MKPKLFINFGLPKTSSTNLQANFYPFIKDVNYLGRIQGAGLDNNPKFFKNLIFVTVEIIMSLIKINCMI